MRLSQYHARDIAHFVSHYIANIGGRAREGCQYDSPFVLPDLLMIYWTVLSDCTDS